MIQRIQTLYLLAVVALGIALIWLPVLQLVSPEEAAELQIYELSAIGGAPLQGLWGLLLTTILIPALALVDIFLYKKRILQARLNIFLTMLCLGYYGVLAIYVWQAKLALGVEWHILPVAHPSLGVIPFDLYGVNPHGYASHPQGRGSRACS